MSGIGGDQRNRKKTSTKMISTGKVKDGREAKTSIKLTIGHTMFMFHEASPRLCIIPGKPVTLIKYLVFIRSSGAT